MIKMGLLLEPKGIVAAEELNILIICVALMLVVVIPVIVMSFIFAYKYREKNTSATYKPEWAHSVTLEIIWWTIPCIIIAILGVITWKTSHSLDPFKPIARNDKQTITVQVMALEWKWLFIYPDQNIATVNYLQLPVNVPVKFEITSNGPMNSFLIPQLGGQIYAMAGMKTELHLIADSIGKYEGLSANFSGNGFANMKFVTNVTTQEAFDQWVKTVKLSRQALTLDTYRELALPSESHPALYSSINKNLFKFVVMKAMMPEKDALYLCMGNNNQLSANTKEAGDDAAKNIIR
jgi:cytochrome o ubiquinol oxidase subunit 2